METTIHFPNCPLCFLKNPIVPFDKSRQITQFSILSVLQSSCQNQIMPSIHWVFPPFTYLPFVFNLDPLILFKGTKKNTNSNSSLSLTQKKKKKAIKLLIALTRHRKSSSPHFSLNFTKIPSWARQKTLTEEIHILQC